MIGNYRQTVRIQGTKVNVRDLQIKRSRSQRTLNISFNSDTAIEPDLKSLTAIGATVQATIEVDGASRDYFADIADIHRLRTVNVTEFRFTCEGREARLRRRRFSGAWADVSAKAVLEDAWSRFGGGLGLTLATDIPTGPTIEEVAIREGTLFELFDEVTGRADFAWLVDGTTVTVWDPTVEPAGRSIDQDSNDIVHGAVDYREDASHIQNAMRGVAYERRQLQAQQDVTSDDCITALYFERPPGFGWEVYEESADFEGDTLRGEPDISAGAYVLSSPFQPDKDGLITLVLKIRRPVIFEITNDASIGTYGPRYAPSYTDDGGLGVDAVKAIMQNNIDQRSEPEVSISLQTARWPFDVEHRAQVDLSDPPFSEELFIDSLTVTSNGGLDATVQLELVQAKTRRAGMKPDPSLVMARRIEKLERKGFHPESEIGRMLNEIGLISFDEFSDVWEHSGEFQTGLIAEWSNGETVEWSNGESVRWTAG